MNKYANAVKANNSPEGYDASFTASTSAVDRHSTVVPQANWKIANFNQNPVISYNHIIWEGSGNPDAIIGKGRAYINSLGNLQLDVKFDDSTSDSGARNETALKVKAKVEKGFLKSVSVGFLEETEGRWLDNEGKDVGPKDSTVYEYGLLQLMEVSVVDLPANPEALVMSKNAEIQELKKELKSMEKFKKELKDVGETMTTVGETMSLFNEADASGDVEVESTTIIDEDLEELEEQKIEQLNILRKRKNRNRFRRINL